MVSSENPVQQTINAFMGNFRARWALMTLYERFEQMVSVALSLIIAILILIALVQLYERVLPLLLDADALNSLLIAAVSIVRFLAIYPFQDGDGRLFRVPTTLIPLRAG